MEDDGRRRRPVLGPARRLASAPKFSWTGPITDPDYIKRAGLAVLLGLLLSLPILAISGVTLAQALRRLPPPPIVAGAWLARPSSRSGTGHYFVCGAALALGLGVVLLMPLIAIALARIDEIAAVAFGRPPRRLASSPPLVPEALRAESVDPCARLLRAAGDAARHARCGRQARLSQSRMRGDHQQHARSGILAAGRGALPDARRALQVPPARKSSRLQGRRAAHRAHPHCARRRDHRRDRRRLCACSRTG